IEPGAGYLACGYVGKGRLEEPTTIIDVIQKHENNKSLLSGKKVLITAGPTREAVDPVRFFSNHSTGKMGFALRSEEHTSELQSRFDLVCRLLLEKKKKNMEISLIE